MGESTSKGMPAPAGKSDAERVAAFVDLLIRAVEVGRAPSRDDPELRELEAGLEAALRVCLHEIGDIQLRLDDLDLAFAGHTVYRSPAREGSIPFALFRDGVREIVLRRGLESGELSALVRALRQATDARGRGWDDAVTLLWEQDFRNVRYACLPVDGGDPAAIEDRSGGAARGTADGGAAGRIPWPAAMDLESILTPPTAETDEERSDDWRFPGAAAPPPPVPQAAPPPLQDVEAENIRMTAKIEEAISSRDQALAILYGILEAESDPAALSDTAAVVGLFLEQAMLEGDFARANQLADRLIGVSGAAAGGSGERRTAAEQAIKQIGREEFLRELVPLLNARPEVDLGELSKLSARLGSGAAPALCNLLYEVQVRKTRRAICEALVVSCKSDVGVLIRQLSDPRWYVVRNILYVLGRIAHQGVERALGEALYHEDIRVRREAICALAEVESPTGRAYLNSALRDPNKEIRILVARLISRRRSDRAAQVIWSVIESPEFGARDPEERTAFFQAVGRTGSDALLPRLERSLVRGAWPRSNDRIERREAALAIAWLGTPGALAVLKREAGSRRDEVREAVASALEILRQSAAKETRPDWGR
jgi:HEAT repeat protein